MLIYLDMSNCGIESLGDVSIWENFIKLRFLYLNNNNLKDPTELLIFSKFSLIVLDLRGNSIDD